jgi:hypothetical protein
MTPRLWALSLAPILAAGTAYAQAPGEVDPTTALPPPPPPAAAAPGYAPPAAPAPGAAPAPAGPCGYAPAAIPVMENRWAIGVAFGGMGVAPDGAPDGSEARFRVAQLAVRYRAARRIELELAMSGGRQVAQDGTSTDGELAAGTVALALRYRFMPEHRWNWFVLGGLGATVIAPHTSNADQRDAAQRPLAMLGVGIERRFRRLALQAELRAVGTGPRKDASGGDAPVVVNGGPAPTMPPPLLPPPDTTAATTYADKLSGGVFTLGASYYF